MNSLLKDVRYSLRMLGKRPGFTLIAVVALALGIGANTAIFSFVNAMLINPFPFPELDRLVAIWDESERGPHNEVAFANWVDWRQQQSSYEDIGLYQWWNANITGIDPPERVQGFRVSANMLDLLRVKPVIGRGFLPEEDQPGKDAVAILSYALWQRRFGGDQSIIDQTITLNGVTRTVIGVMPDFYNFPRGMEVMAPLTMTPERMRSRGSHSYLAIARLRDGVSLDQSQADLDSITARLSEQYPETNTGLGAKAYPLLDDTVRMYRAVLLLLMAAVAFVLLIACANVANLMLVRASGRFKEIAIRSALGASRWRISRQLLIESVLLATAGGALGVLVGSLGIDLMRAFLPSSDVKFIPGFDKIGINLPVMGFTLAISIATGLLFGLAPAWHSSRTSLSDSLKEGGRQSGSASGRNRLRGLLVVAEIALSVVLLVGAGLMVKSFWLLSRTNPGFNSEGILTMGLSLTGQRYRQDAPVFTFYRDLVERVKTLPGVTASAVVNYLPLGGSNSSSSFLVEGIPEPPPGQEFSGRYRVCSPDYFSTMGINVVQGRAFTEQDKADSQRVIIVSETLAHRYWPDQEAVGKRMRFTGALAENPWMVVVGVVNDVRHQLDLEFTSDYYLPHSQDSWTVMMLVARTTAEPMALSEPIRGEVQGLDRDQPVFNVKAMEQVRLQSMMMYTVSGTWMSIFAGIALVLAAIGLYGVMSYTVSQRTHEIGVRMALGAKTGDVVRMVMRQGVGLIAIGLAIGLAGSIALTRVIAGLLFGAASGNSGAFVAMAAFLTVVALLACYVPARRATKVDPMIALRYE